MHNLKRLRKPFFACLVLLLALSVSGVAEVNLESALPIVTEPVSVSIGAFPQGSMVYSEYDEETFWFTRFMRENSGLDITWEVYDPSSAAETKSLLMASGDMPDMLQGVFFSAADVYNFGQLQGLLYPVDTLLEYMPTFSAILEKQPELRAAITAPDGHIYGFPALGDGKYRYSQRFWINTDWLKNVGMENPTTLEELYQVLKAFKEQDANGNGDPNDEIPFSGSWDENYSERGLILTAYGFASCGNNLSVDYTDGVDAEDKQLIYVPYAPEYKDYLHYMNKLYTEGLIDQDIFTQSEVQAMAKLNDHAVGLYGGAHPESDYTASANPRVYNALNALVDTEGDTPTYGMYTLINCFAHAVISADVTEEKAAALANLIDYYYTPEYYNYAWYGPEYESEYDYQNTGVYFNEETGGYAFMGQGDMSRWTYKVTYFQLWETPGYVNVGNMYYEADWAAEHPDSVVAEILEKNGAFMWYEQQLVDTIVPYYVESVPPMFMDEDDTERVSILISQLDDYVKGMEVKFITGELDIDAEYDNFIATLEKYGVKEFEEIQNKYYDIYKSNL